MSLRAVVAHIQGLMVMVVTDVTQLNKEHHLLCCWSEPNSSLTLLPLLPCYIVTFEVIISHYNNNRASFEDFPKVSKI